MSDASRPLTPELGFCGGGLRPQIYNLFLELANFSGTIFNAENAEDTEEAEVTMEVSTGVVSASLYEASALAVLSSRGGGIILAEPIINIC